MREQNNELMFMTNGGIERFRITSSGNFYIGLADNNPSYTLNVGGIRMFKFFRGYGF